MADSVYHILFSKYLEDMKELTRPLEKYLQINTFAFKRNFLDGTKIYLYNNGDLYRDYFNNEFYKLGNMEANAIHYQNSYNLWKNLPDPYNIYDFAYRVHKITAGATLIRQRHLFCDFFFFASTYEKKRMNEVFVREQSALEMFSEYFMIRAKKIIEAAEKDRTLVPYSTEQECFNSLVNSQTSDFKKELLSYYRITNREKECLKYLQTGLSNKEIALKFQISPRTVDDYINKLKEKFECDTKMNLVSKITTLNLI